MISAIDSKKAFEALAAAFFLLLFPGFFFYHQGVASGVFSGFLGGFYSPICLVAIISFLPFWRYWGVLFFRSPKYCLLILFFFVWTLLSALITARLSAEYYMKDALYQYLNALVYWVALIFVGAGLNFESAWFRRVLWISGWGVLLVLVNYVILTGSFQYYAAQFYDVEQGVASYQGFARSALFLAFALLAITKTTKGMLLVTVASVFVLFTLSARSEFAAVIVAVILFFMVRSIKDKKNLVLLFSLGVVSLISLTAFYSHIENTRQAKLLHLDGDTSWQSRNEKASDALRRIERSPLVGEFGGHFESGGKGDFAHNIISAWDSFGFFGFAAFAVLIFIPFVNSSRSVVAAQKLQYFQVMFFVVSAATLLLMLAAKNIYWAPVTLVLGMYLNCNGKVGVGKK